MTSVWSWDEDGSGLRTGGGGWWRMVKAEKGGLEGWVEGVVFWGSGGLTG